MKQHCYFHKNQPIQHFCLLKQCTLPLCDQCLQIHEQQHLAQNQSSQIISYQQAYQQVFTTLQKYITENNKSRQLSFESINNDKKQAVRMIEDYFSEFENQLKNETKFLNQIQQKMEKIKKGSIKTVIYYYSGDINLKQLHFPQITSISNSIQQCINQIGIQKNQPNRLTKQNSTEKPIQKSNAQSNFQNYDSRFKSNSKKRLIFSNDKPQTSNHKNTNGPYLHTETIQQKPVYYFDKRQEKTLFEPYQRQKIRLQSQKSQVKNYFDNQNLYKKQSFPRHNNQRHQLSSSLQKPCFMQRENNNILRQSPMVSNLDYRVTRSKTIDKIPSMTHLTLTKENIYVPLQQKQERTLHQRQERINGEFKSGKWGKSKFDAQRNNREYQKQQEVYSQFTLNQNNRINTEFTNRRPLKTTDLQTYNPLANISAVAFQTRDRRTSYEIGLRNTVSQNNLQVGKKLQPLLGDDLKKQVLSPIQIRRMLQKKIEERNKTLAQKKEYQLKINSERVGLNQEMKFGGSDLRGAGDIGGLSRQKEKQAYSKNVEETNNRGVSPSERRNPMYSTKDTIINQIYRQNRC